MSDPASEFFKRSLPYVGLLSVLGLGLTVWQLYSARSDLSHTARTRAIERCESQPRSDACRDRVAQLHHDCFRWSLSDHGERPTYDRGKYQRCLKHPPGKFR